MAMASSFRGIVTKGSKSKGALKDGGQRLLYETVQRIASGKLNALEELYALPAQPELEAQVTELAEGIGMNLVKLEAREFHIRRAAEVEQRL
ncbi:MAG: hypothetical protein O7C61_09715 [SAR324 cluster bacterium]|nr:hypothetical protein [SAR324 cluster bacterium]